MTTFQVWAPGVELAEVEAAGKRHRMLPGRRPGWWVADVPAAGHGTDYGFLLDGKGRLPAGTGSATSGSATSGSAPGGPAPGGPAHDGPAHDGSAPEPLPDPRSLWQPYGVHGRSRVYEHERFQWTDQGWRGRPLAGGVIYEMHVGTFTPEGTFDAAIGYLEHLTDLGVDIVELMPVAAFPGRYGWGYDGVHLWAVHDPYGGPDGLKRFVDACHAHGLGVVLDVVYNHLGPSGNYLGRFGPYFTAAHTTPWGDAVNFDQPGSDEVRAFVVENARMWLRDYHIDGLRLDAVHAISDRRAVRILEELAVEVSRLRARLGRDLYLVAESDLNDPRLVTAREGGGYGIDAQWSDDFHHAVHAALTGERQGYYCDFGSLGAIGKTLTGAYFHDGTMSTFRGRHHGRPIDRTRLPGHRFLGFLQNHDQVGNRATGDRLSATLSVEQLKIAAALLLTSPFTPLLFMGEEWAASTPWCYFTDHVDPELAEAVRDGRRAEFARHGWDAAQIPDPQDPRTAQGSILDWSEPARAPHRDLMDWYKALIALRRRHPDLMDARLSEVLVICSHEFADEDIYGGGFDAAYAAYLAHGYGAESGEAHWVGDTGVPGTETVEDWAERWLVVHRGDCRVAVNFSDSPVRLLPEALDGDRFDTLLVSEPEVRIERGLVHLPGRSVAILRRTGTGRPDDPFAVSAAMTSGVVTMGQVREPAAP